MHSIELRDTYLVENVANVCSRLREGIAGESNVVHTHRRRRCKGREMAWQSNVKAVGGVVNGTAF